MSKRIKAASGWFWRINHMSPTETFFLGFCWGNMIGIAIGAVVVMLSLAGVLK